MDFTIIRVALQQQWVGDTERKRQPRKRMHVANYLKLSKGDEVLPAIGQIYERNPNLFFKKELMYLKGSCSVTPD